MNCDIVIPIFNRLEMTKNCLESIKEKTTSPYRFIIIDNGSDQDTKSYLEGFARSNSAFTLIRNPENLGWVKAVNQGLKAATAAYVCLLNNDTIARTSGWLSGMIEICEKSADIGIVNPCFEITKIKKSAHDTDLIEMDFARGHCMLIKRQVIEKIGFFDEAYGMGYVDDADYSVRAIRAGFRCVMMPGVIVEHLRNSTFLSVFNSDKVSDIQKKNGMLFQSKFGRHLRIVAIVTQKDTTGKTVNTLLNLARRQHRVYIWNFGRAMHIAHTTIKERIFPRFCPRFFLLFLLYLNSKKNQSKHYDVIFTDNERLKPIPPDDTYKVFFASFSNYSARIIEIVDKLSGRR